MRSSLAHAFSSQFASRLLGLALAILAGLFPLPAAASTMIALSLADTVRQSDAIVVGVVTARQSRWGDDSHRWMVTDYTFAVDEVVMPSAQGLPIGATVVLTYWGGTIGDETQRVADLRMPGVGERLLVVLHDRWSQGGTFAPTVGFDQGLFTIAAGGGGGNVVSDAAGRPLMLTGDGRIEPGSGNSVPAAGRTRLELPRFTRWLRDNLGAIRSSPAPQRPTVDPNDPRLMKVFAKAPSVPGGTLPGPGASIALPAQGDGPGAGIPSAGRPPASTSTSGTNPVRRDKASSSVSGYSSNHQAHAPIVINSFPAHFTDWYPEDQYLMSRWNYYAPNLFKVYVTPSGTYSWGDGIFDLAGWPSNADLQYMYGSSWYCGPNCTPYGVTFRRFDGGGWIIEADIALNPAVGWTLDDEWVFEGGPAVGFRQTMIHELGHMHGLEHNFSFLALMNYLPGNYRAFALPYADDAEGVRAEYPANAAAVTDLAVYLYSESGPCFDGTYFYNCVSEASHPSMVSPGGILTVNNYLVENVGTTTIAAPTIEWYLTSSRGYQGSYYYLGQTTFSSLPRFYYFDPSLMLVSLPVPAGVAPGSYYLGAYIRNDGGTSQPTFPFSNNYAFTRQRIMVAGSALAFSQPTYAVTEGGPAISVTVTRTGSSSGPVSVTWTTANGTAVAGSDFGTSGNFAPRTGTLSWASGDSAAKTITIGASTSNIPVIDDSSIEGDEYFTIALSSPTGGAVVGAQSTTAVFIADNESIYNFDTATTSVNENGPNILVGITRTGSLVNSSTVKYTASNGTALAGTDFGTSGSTTQPTGVITFGAGVSSKVITIGPTSASAPFIPVINDAVIEGPKTFNVTLSLPTGGGQLGATKTVAVTINSDEKGVQMAGPALSLAESAGASFVQVNRVGSPAGALSVNYSFANGTAVNGTNFSGSPGTLGWADGDASPRFIPVTIVDNSVVNANRTFTVTLSGASGGSVATPASTTVTVMDDDNTLQFGSAISSVAEGSTASLVVTRLGVTANPASVVWTVANGTAMQGTDFGSLGAPSPALTGTLAWNAGDGAGKSISIATIQNTTPQGPRAFAVTLSSPTGATLGAALTSTVTINDNDPGLVLGASTYNVLENAGNLTVTVNRAGPALASASVQWTTANGTGPNGAIAGTRFGTPGSTAQRSGTLSWAAGDGAAKTFLVPIINNAASDGDATFTVSLNTPSPGSTLGGPGAATVTIVDDDAPPESELAFAQPKYLVLENAGNVTVTVSRNDIGGGFGRSATVNYATANGTALVTSDYTTKAGTLMWAGGDGSARTISIPITNDAVAEGPESFQVQLSNVSPGTRIATPSAIVAILDDDEVFPRMGAFPAGWTTPAAASAGWMVSNDPGAFEGVFALRSEAIDDGQSAQMQLTGTFSPGTVSFRLRISSEAGFDVLRFYVDGVLQPGAQWSGTAVTGWTAFAVAVPAGAHTLTWSYEKDASASVGSDAAWIDAVSLPPYTP